MSQPTHETTSIGRYLVDRIGGLGVEHVFGIPGDYVLGANIVGFTRVAEPMVAFGLI